MSDHLRRVLELETEAAWLRRCGPTGDPGEWMSGEVLPVHDDDVEVELYPTWKVGGSWSSMHRSKPDAAHAWCWLIRCSDFTEDEFDVLDDLGFLIDGNSVDLLVDGDHTKRPAVPDAVVAALALLAGESPA